MTREKREYAEMLGLLDLSKHPEIEQDKRLALRYLNSGANIPRTLLSGCLCWIMWKSWLSDRVVWMMRRISGQAARLSSKVMGRVCDSREAICFEIRKGRKAGTAGEDLFPLFLYQSAVFLMEYPLVL